MRSQWFLQVLIGFCCLGLIWGCGQSDPLGRRSISGTVTEDGTPVEHGTIRFEPIDPGTVPGGAVITQGKFSIPRDQGLAPGEYRVVIRFIRGGIGPDLPEGVMPGEEPEEMDSAEWVTNSDHVVEVTDSGETDFAFDL